MKLWDIENGEIIKTLEGHTEGVNDVAWSEDGEWLASASDDKTIWIWNLEDVSFCPLNLVIAFSTDCCLSYTAEYGQSPTWAHKFRVLRKFQSTVEPSRVRRV